MYSRLTQITDRSAVIGLYTSYVVPILLRITSGRNKLTPGPFTLGRWATPIGIVAVAWVSFIVVMLLFPPGQTTTAEDMSVLVISFTCIDSHPNQSDYAIVIISAVFIFATVSWVTSAHKWFYGPVKNVGEEEEVTKEKDLQT